MNKTLVSWTDVDGYYCQKWVDVELTREQQIEKDVAASIERTNSTIFGYSWEQIQAMQQGKK